MEVRQQVIDAAELEARRDEELRPAGERAAARERLEHAHVVVPTASTRSARRIRSHAAGRDLVALAVDRVLLDASACDGRNVSSPTCSVTRSTSSRASSSGVKCSPAVGAAAEPGSRAYTVW